MDYYQIGQRIRKYRKALGLSQDALVREAVDRKNAKKADVEEEK